MNKSELTFYRLIFDWFFFCTISSLQFKCCKSPNKSSYNLTIFLFSFPILIIDLDLFDVYWVNNHSNSTTSNWIQTEQEKRTKNQNVKQRKPQQQQKFIEYFGICSFICLPKSPNLFLGWAVTVYDILFICIWVYWFVR